ncbi:MAG: PepSY domain-containing protein [Solirubrobacterales bacterium]|nr:PepSY domain-containing protein [Solirubrobacterales bacterium]
MKNLKQPLIAAGVAMLAAGTLACTANGDPANRPGEAAPAGAANAHTSAASHVPQARRAVRTAESAVGAGMAFDLERDRHRGARVWEVEVDSGHARPIEVLVSRDGRTVVRKKKTGPSDDVRKVRRAKVSLDSALGKANPHADGRLTEADIDRHRGKLVWEVNFRDGKVETEVKIDAASGGLVGVDRELDD